MKFDMIGAFESAQAALEGRYCALAISNAPRHKGDAYLLRVDYRSHRMASADSLIIIIPKRDLTEVDHKQLNENWAEVLEKLREVR